MEMKEDGEAGGGEGRRGVTGGVVGDTSRGRERSTSTVNYKAVIIAQVFRLTSLVFSRNHCQFSPVGNHQYITRHRSRCSLLPRGSVINVWTILLAIIISVLWIYHRNITRLYRQTKSFAMERLTMKKMMVMTMMTWPSIVTVKKRRLKKSERVREKEREL